jgi:hypothetical protein
LFPSGAFETFGQNRKPDLQTAMTSQQAEIGALRRPLSFLAFCYSLADLVFPVAAKAMCGIATPPVCRAHARDPQVRPTSFCIEVISDLRRAASPHKTHESTANRGFFSAPLRTIGSSCAHRISQ